MRLDVRNLSVCYSPKAKALDNVSFSFGNGILGLLGKNGAGKTTLIKTVLGLIKPISGSVSLTDPDAEVRISYMPQETALHPSLTIYESLDYHGILCGLPKNVRADRITSLLNETNLSEHKNKKIRRLSGGMKRRAGLAQAMLNDPSFLVIDEPTVGLDPEERINIRNLIYSFSSKRTIVFSTHIIEDLASVCRKLIVLDKGKLIYDRSVEELFGLAESKVFLIRADSETELNKLSSELNTVGVVHTSKGRFLKYVGKTPVPGSFPTEASIEDAYLCLYL